MRKTRIAAAVALAALALASAASAVSPPHADATPPPLAPCDRWAAPAGDNAASGTEAAPYRNIAYLIGQLEAGQTGCLESGARFDEPPGSFIVPGSAGTPSQPITIRSFDPADPAQVHAQMWLQPNADDIVFRDLSFIGSPGPPKSVMLIIGGADGIGFYDNDVTFRGGTCFNVGALDEAQPAAAQPENSSDRFVLAGNRIHDCGADAVLTGADSGTHGVYLMNTRGAIVADNYIYDNKNRGIQLYPVARDSVIEHNLLDGNGSNLNISSEVTQFPDYLSSGNVARANLITNSVLRARYDPDWPDADITQIWAYGFGGPARGPNDAPTHGNAVTGNCISQADPAHNFGGWGYAQSENVFADPGYLDRPAKNFALPASSPCAGLGPRTPARNVESPVTTDDACDRARAKLGKAKRKIKRAKRRLKQAERPAQIRRARKALRGSRKAVRKARSAVAGSC